ncbi:MAG: putative sulfate/molybdate transporter [Methanobacteriota archaeon]
MNNFKFDRMELAGSISDLGTMLPLLIPLVVINGLNATIVLLIVGLVYIGTGLYYKIPVPVQPLKAVAVISITAGLSAQIIVASGLVMGVLMLFLGVTGLIVQISRVFSKPVIRGVQVALGLILFVKAVQYIIGSNLFISGESISLMGIPVNAVFGLAGVLIAAFLLTNKKIPAAIVLIVFGFLVGLVFKTPSFTFGPQTPSIQIPTMSELQTAFLLLVLPQIPVTLSNAVISTSDLSKKYFKNGAARASPKALACSIGIADVATGILGGMPVCHGAGGLAAHYRFGARTGGSSLIIGSIFIIMALVFGSSAVSILGLIPLSILGVMLAFAGIQMMLLAADVKEQNDLLIVFIIVGLAVVIDMAIAFMIGLIAYYILKWWYSWRKK